MDQWIWNVLWSLSSIGSTPNSVHIVCESLPFEGLSVVYVTELVPLVYFVGYRHPCYRTPQLAQISNLVGRLVRIIS